MGRDVAVAEFRAKRKRPNQDKTVEGYLLEEKEIDHEHFIRARSLTAELEQVTIKQHNLSLQQFIDTMAQLVLENEDITEDIKTIRKGLYTYLGTKNRFCTKCDGTGKTQYLRRTKILKEPRPLQNCSACKGTGKKAKPASFGTKRTYTVRFDKLFRYFGLFNRIDFKNLKFPMEKAKKAKIKPLRYEVLKGLIAYTTLMSRKVFWQFLAQSACREIEGLKIRKSDCYYVDKTGEETKNISEMDRIKIMIRAEKGNKTRVERETFVHIEIQEYVLDRLSKIDDNDFVFHNAETPKKQRSTEIPAFEHARKMMIKEGYKELAEKTPDDTKHKITLHTLRKYFVSKVNRMNDSSFGNAIAGHDFAMKELYDGIEPQELLEMWKQSEKYTSLLNDNSQQTEELEKEVSTLKSELNQSKEENQKNNQELYEKIFDLMNQIENLKSK